MQPLDLLKTAEHLLRVSNNRPAQANLKRAQSTLYYALFHCLARACADGFLGGSSAKRSRRAWNQVYRALDHKPAKNRCTDPNMMSRFPPILQAFAANFAALQTKRHKADYDPAFRLTKSEVKQDIGLVRQLLTDTLHQPVASSR